MSQERRKPGMTAQLPASTYHTTRRWYSRRSRTALIIVSILLSIYLYASTMDTPKDHDLSRYHQTVFFPYIYNISSGSMPMVKATINGSAFELPMDTGSTGLLMGAPLLADVGPEEGTPAYEYLTSSNILYNGRLVDLSVTFYGLDGLSATARVPVLIVDKSVICPWYDPSVDTFECPPNPDGPEPKPRDTSKITYMGVGFGRNTLGDGQPNAVPSGNPFLNIQSINGETLGKGSMRAGYIISREGVHLGLTKDNTRDFAFIDLEPGVTHDIDGRDWAMVDMCFRLDDGNKSRGPGLIDTGISQMYLRTDVGIQIPNVTVRNPNKDSKTKWVQRVKPGTKIAIGFPSLDDSIASYAFEVGSGALMEPSYVVPGKPRPPPFVNTGRNFLLGFSVAFDAVGGRFGFRPARPASL